MRSFPSQALLTLLIGGVACSPTSENADGVVYVPAAAAPQPVQYILATPGAPQVVAQGMAPGAGAMMPGTVVGVPPTQTAEPPRTTIAASSTIAFNRPGPTPLAPPPLKKVAALPALPALPAIAAYPKTAPPARGPDIEGCGHVWTGTEWVKMECIDPKNGPHRAAQVVIPYERMRPPIEQLPTYVDHRLDGTEGPVRKQHGPECTTFAFTSALDHAYARWAGAPGNFSVMQIWGRYHKKQEHAAADANIGDVVSNEADWPYDGPLANSWKYCHGDEKPGELCGKQPDEGMLRAIDQKAVAMITKIEVVPTSQVEVLREKIAAGQDVAVTIKMPTFSTTGADGAKYVIGVPPNNPSKPPKGEHVTLLVGYAMTPNGVYYLVHNSWGTKWGDQGYAWLHEDLLKAYWMDKLMVIPYVEPLQVARDRADAQGGLSRACDGDQIPDSISGLCAPRCADGSPRHNDVCARPGECGRGQVNLTGECTLAAPSGAANDPSGVTWQCGPGGCTYLMPKGVLNCVERSCAVSCPAPDFRLATTPRGFVCVD
jgi:hypothetical protein